MNKCCLETVKKFIKETEVTVGDFPAFPPKSWAKDKSKVYEFEKLIRKYKQEEWIKVHLGNYLKSKKNGVRKSRIRPLSR